MISNTALQTGLDPLLDDWAVERVTGRARSTLQKDRVAGTGIPFIRIGRLVRYREADVQQYLRELPSYKSTSAACAAELLLDQRSQGTPTAARQTDALSPSLPEKRAPATPLDQPL